MATPATDPVDLLHRIRALESELAGYWRSLRHSGPGELPLALHVLEIVVDGLPFMVPVHAIREVVGMVWPHPLAEAPPWIMGTFSFGDALVPLVDLGQRLSGRVASPSPRQRIVVVDRPQWLGLVVDEVGRVLEVDTARLQSPGAAVPFAEFLIGVVVRDDGTCYHIVSPERLGRELEV